MHDEPALLARCYEKSLRLAVEHRCKSVAFPLISAGVFGCPADVAIRTATQAIENFLQKHDIEVYLVIFDPKAFKIAKKFSSAY